MLFFYRWAERSSPFVGVTRLETAKILCRRRRCVQRARAPTSHNAHAHTRLPLRLRIPSTRRLLTARRMLSHTPAFRCGFVYLAHASFSRHAVCARQTSFPLRLRIAHTSFSRHAVCSDPSHSAHQLPVAASYALAHSTHYLLKDAPPSPPPYEQVPRFVQKTKWAKSRFGWALQVSLFSSRAGADEHSVWRHQGATAPVTDLAENNKHGHGRAAADA